MVVGFLVILTAIFGLVALSVISMGERRDR